MKIDGVVGETCLQEITFAEGEDFSTVQLLKTGKFAHPFMDELEITEEMFKSFKKNFDKKVKKIDLATDFSHNSHLEASGWITDVILKEKNTELWIKVEWTEAARKKIKDKEYKYMSADFSTKFIDNETGKDFGATLNGGALTNRPFIKGMDAILHDLDVSDKKRQAIKEILDNKDEPKKEEKVMTFDELKQAAKDANLSEAETKELAKEFGFVLAEEKPESKEDDVQLSAEQKENGELKDKIALMEKEKSFDALLSDGKACEAQRKSFLAGDMAEFAKLHMPINLGASGSGEEKKGNESKDDKDLTFDEAQDKAEILVAACIKENKDLHFADVHKKVLRDNPEIAKVMNSQ